MEDQQFTYQLPRMNEVKVTRDIRYATRGDTDLTLDVYQPPNGESRDVLPAVIFVHGDGRPERLDGIKDHEQYQMWGRLVAASGLIGVTFNHRSSQMLSRVMEPVEDVRDAIAFVRRRSHEFGVDPDRLAIWSCSAGGYLGLQAALNGNPDYMRCAVCYYGVIDLELYVQRVGTEPVSGLAAFNPMRSLRENEESRIPLQIVRVGQDRPELNASVDSFIRSALELNVNLELINYAAGAHAFDFFDDSPTSQGIIQRTLDFLAQNL